jgi:polyphosphate kinase 2 (PPK2 family)
LAHWQGRLARAVHHPAFASRSLALVFEGSDAAGKGGAIRRLTHALDVRQMRIMAIAAPSAEALSRPYLWRFWRDVPTTGRVAIFDRSWYGRVLVERVEGFAKPAEWKRAYDEIRDFEEQLVEHGTIVVKCWLAITKEEQLARFRERESVAFKRYKITADDWRNRRKWTAYRRAVNDMFAQTDTQAAPWALVASDDKRFARVEVVKAIALAVEQALGIKHKKD